MFYDLIKNQVSILDVISKRVDLKRQSNNYLGLCPFHSEKTPSFSVNPIKKFFYCFGCHAGGDVISFVSQIEGSSYKQSALQLAKDYNIEIPKTLTSKEEKDEFEELHNILELALGFYKQNLSKEVINYLASRGIRQEDIERFEIGYAPGNNYLRKFLDSKSISLLMMDKTGLIGRKGSDVYEVFRRRIIFPIRDNYNRLIAFGGRCLDGAMPKYLNSPETQLFQKSEVLYGLNFAYKSCYKTNRVIVVEGYMDLIKMHIGGFTETVATLGTAISSKHLDQLWNTVDEVIICFDGDTAGLRAAKKVVELALGKITTTKHISFMMLPNNFDPDDVISKKGSKYMEYIIQGRKPLSEMIWMLEAPSSISVKSPEVLSKVETNLNKYLDHIHDKIVVKNFKRFFLDQLWQLTKRPKKSKQASIYTLSLPEYNLVEISLIGLLIKYPELFDEEEVLANIKEIEFSSQHKDFISAEKIFALQEKVLLTIQTHNPSFFASLAKSDPKEIFLNLAKKHKFVSLQKEFNTLAKDDIKKFWEFYQHSWPLVEELLSDKE